MKKRLIIVDDDPGIQDAFQIILSRAGYEVTVYSSGEPLLSNHYQLPDAFILDKQLSGTDGLDICRFLKKEENSKHIPVIMLSANPYIDKLAIEAGANDYLEKPFGIKALLALLQKYI